MEEELVLILQKLVGVVEDASPKLWEIAMAQARVEGIRAVFLGVLFSLLVLVAFWFIKFSAKKFQDSDRDEDVWGIGMVVSGAGMWFFIGFMIAYLYEAIGYLSNPAYYAIKIIMELVK